MSHKIKSCEAEKKSPHLYTKIKSKVANSWKYAENERNKKLISLNYIFIDMTNV